MVRFWPNLAQQADGLEGPLLIGFQTIAPHNGIFTIDPERTRRRFRLGWKRWPFNLT